MTCSRLPHRYNNLDEYMHIQNHYLASCAMNCACLSLKPTFLFETVVIADLRRQRFRFCERFTHVLTLEQTIMLLVFVCFWYLYVVTNIYTAKRSSFRSM